MMASDQASQAQPAAQRPRKKAGPPCDVVPGCRMPVRVVISLLTGLRLRIQQFTAAMLTSEGSLGALQAIAIVVALSERRCALQASALRAFLGSGRYHSGSAAWPWPRGCC